MSRVLFVVAAFLCIALSCAAQKDEWRYGGGRSAVTLDDAPTEEDKKKIVGARRVASSARVQVDKLIVFLHSFSVYCDSSREQANNVRLAVSTINDYVKRTEEYLTNFTGLGVEEKLEELKGAQTTVNGQSVSALPKKDEVCKYSEDFSNKRADILKAMRDVETALTGLETKFSDEAVATIKQKAEEIKKQAEVLQRDTEREEPKIRRKFQFVEETGTAADELRLEMKSVFEIIEIENDKCIREFRKRLAEAPFRQPDDTEYETRIRLQVCQKKKKENADSSKKNEESNKTEPPKPTTKPDEETTKSPKPTTKPDEETTKSPKPTTKPDEETTKEPKPTTKPDEDKNNSGKDDNKRDEKNDGAARHAVLQNVFIVCLFVAGLSVLTTA